LELRNHGIPNAKSFLHLYNAQLKVKIMELLRKQDLQSEKIKSLLMKAQKDYKAVYDSAFYSSQSDYTNSVYMPPKRKIDELNNVANSDSEYYRLSKRRSDDNTRHANRLLNANDLTGLSNAELRIMRNEIYARHGYIFQSKDLRDYFSKKSWYIPLHRDVSDKLTDIEIKNINFLKKHEK
jgi:hypothetical protein